MGGGFADVPAALDAGEGGCQVMPLPPRHRSFLGVIRDRSRVWGSVIGGTVRPTVPRGSRVKGDLLPHRSPTVPRGLGIGPKQTVPPIPSPMGGDRGRLLFGGGFGHATVSRPGRALPLTYGARSSWP